MDADRAGAGGASGSAAAVPRASTCRPGQVQIVPAHVAPEELDAADAADAKRRLKAGPTTFLRAAPGRTGDHALARAAELNKDVVMVELEGISRVRAAKPAFAAMPASGSPVQERHAFLDALTRELRLMAARGTPKEERTLENRPRTKSGDDRWRTKSSTTARSRRRRRRAPRRRDDGSDAARQVRGGAERARRRAIPSRARRRPSRALERHGLDLRSAGRHRPNTYLGAFVRRALPRVWRWYEKEAAAQAVRRDVRTRSTRFPCFTTPPSSATATTRAGTTVCSSTAP